MASFVLIPGAWHGGWCWKRLAPLLRGASHAVYPITLTGLGERAHLAKTDTGLETHVRDVVNIMEWEELREAVVVGHSYAGMDAAGVAGRMPGRVKHVVILDGFLPADGQSLADIKGAEFLDRCRDRAERGGCPWLVPPPKDATFDLKEPQDIAWLRAKLTPHPLRSFTEPVRIEHPLAEGDFGRTFLQCWLPGQPHWKAPQDSFRRVEIEAGHDAMIDAPELMARTLLDLL